MVEGPVHSLPPINPLADDDDTGSDSRVESNAMMTSSPTHGVALMAKGEIPELSDFFKKMTVTDEEHQAYHNHGWLTSNLVSTIPKVHIPTVAGFTVVCFESHLIAGLGLPPGKFLATILGYLNYELVHFNTNAISALSSFMMLCKCCLGIAPDVSLF
jgi:hypothetical protein